MIIKGANDCMIIQDEILDKIVEDYKNGISPDKLSEKYPDFSPYQIRENLKRIGVFKSSFFTQTELNNLKEDYKFGYSTKQLAEKYNRPEETIKKKLQSLGLYIPKDTNPPYSPQEIAILKQYYPIGDWDTLYKLLPNRNKQSIRGKASKLGISQQSWFWTEEKVIAKLKTLGFNLLSSFSNQKEKHDIIDNDGYKYRITLANLLFNATVPLRFSENNFYTVYNINHYIHINKIDCTLLSMTYTNNTAKLLWKCHCGNEFECSWQNFYNGKHQCNDCSCVDVHDKLSYSVEEVKKLIADKPYKMIDSTFTRLTNGFDAITNNGFYIRVNKDNVLKNKEPEIFHPQNPYTIQNINHYIKINNIKTKLLSTTYKNNTSSLEWNCGCGKKFERGWNAFQGGATECLECSSSKRGLDRRIEYNNIINKIEENGYHLMEELRDEAISEIKFSVYDDDGYRYETTWSKMRNSNKPERFHPSNKYTIYNINHYLDIYRDGEYSCISTEYYGNDKNLLFKHKTCGCEFYATLIEMQGKFSPNKKDKYYKQCPNCNTNKTESNHASILKQIFLHEYPDTQTEEKSCKNPKTNRSLPTDIVNHNLKIAIEVQSSFHDSEEKQLIDIFKKNYWLNKGYKFYDPDIREYSILEMVQLFFPDIKELPSYIDFNFSNCIDYTKVQDLLDEGYVISEISKTLGIKRGTIQGFVSNKKVFLPDGYKNKVFNIKPIIRLSKDNCVLSRFDSLSDADKSGFKSGTVNRVLNKKQDFSYDSYWVYEEDYINGNYSIPTEQFDKFDVPVDKYDMDNNYIKSYHSIYEAEKDSVSNKSEIFRVASGDRKSSRNEKWKFKNVA